MFVSADTMALLVASGVPAEKLVEIIRSIERDVEAVRPVARSSNAERQRRYRERQAESVTRNVTNNATDCDASAPSPSLPPQTPPSRPHPRGEIITRARKGRSGESAGFDVFWATYPRRDGRKPALAAFSKALGRITEDDPLAVILAGVERAMPGWLAGDSRFIPMAASWLNADRWTDEAPTHLTTAQRPQNVHRPDRHTAQLDHFAAIHRAMVGTDRAEPERCDFAGPGDPGGMRALPSAA